MKYLIPIFLFVAIDVAAQIPEREIVTPSSGNFNVGSQYKNQESIINEKGIPREPMPYFNYEDFKDIEPVAQLVAEPPYQNESDLNGIPHGKLHFYYEKGIDSSSVQYLSRLLYEAKEPVLNNYFLGQEIYRLTWTRSFHDNYILTLISNSKNEQPEIRITKIDRSTGQPEKSIKKIKKADFDKFKKRLENSNFWIMKPYEWTSGFDGSTWTIEAHAPIAYKMLCRRSPGLRYEDDLILRQLGTWLISKSGITVEEIY